ncbi:solute carrier organic anion transporter family member 74D-like isoform X3 [Schistocerca cancellata]|uniref:solute carrier organic anion transporter family member 74D-like isoform X3 n=1 Tax=Schistocerca cancellata TaxID=274614 RepID=UPI00211837D4|nr:solute carrier organic anion transporter family member 74D-like isoform X3 [Schistocerca cancellata]
MAAESGCDDRSEGHTAPRTPMLLVDPQLRDASATEPSEHEAHSPDQDEHGLVCGLAGWTPSWLQRFATVNTYTLLWGLLGMAEIAINSYLGAIINTLEKSFELTTTTSAASQFVRMLGPTVGYLLASYSLSRFVAPGLTPLIDETDPRWIGAWWIGWAPLSAFALLLAVPLMLFPREMPATRQRSSKSPRRVLERSLADFWKSTRRLLGNRLMMCNTFSSVLFMFGMSGSWAYMPKYMETHFQQSASTSSLVLGSFGLVSTALGLAASGVVIWRFQPRPRSLAAWNVVVELIDAFVRVSWAFIGCADDYISGVRTSNGRWNMTSDCNNACSCGPHVTFSPVCDEGSGDTYFSPCHAGCNDGYVINGTTVFGNCSCLPGSGTATAGPCPTDCASVFIAFLVTQSVLQCLEASGRAGNALLHFRCVDEIDKAQAVAFAEAMLTGLAYIPAPIIYGMIIDSSCWVWSETCGSRGNCWLYDMARMRHAPNILAAGFLFSGTFLDIGVWYYAKDVRLYDEGENVAGGEDRDLKLSTLAAALS